MPDIDDRDLRGQLLLDRIRELTKEIDASQRNGWRPLLLACKDEIIQRIEEMDGFKRRVRKWCREVSEELK